MGAAVARCRKPASVVVTAMNGNVHHARRGFRPRWTRAPTRHADTAIFATDIRALTAHNSTRLEDSPLIFLFSAQRAVLRPQRFALSTDGDGRLARLLRT